MRSSVFPFREQKAGDLAFLNDIIGFTYLYDAETETYAALETVKIKWIFQSQLYQDQTITS
jgi:hypothetical protein